MIHEYERYYGTVFMELFEQSQSKLSIEPINTERTSFLINGKLGLYIKHSSSRSNSWSFGFRAVDYEAIRELNKISEEIAFACVCGFHGVTILNNSDFAICAGFPEDLNSRITVRTKLKGSWTVTGSLGELRTTRSKTKPWHIFEDYLTLDI